MLHFFYDLLKSAFNKQMRVRRMPRQRARSKSSIEHLAHCPRKHDLYAPTSFATSCSTSFQLAHGRITLLAPAWCAPNTFSLIPPTGTPTPLFNDAGHTICGTGSSGSSLCPRKRVKG